MADSICPGNGMSRTVVGPVSPIVAKTVATKSCDQAFYDRQPLSCALLSVAVVSLLEAATYYLFS